MSGAKCEIRVQSADGDVSEFEFVVVGEAVLGREAACDIVLEGGGVSAQHAAIRYRDGRLQARDLASRFGTFVGEVRVVGWTTLSDGDVLWVGDVSVEIALSTPARPVVVAISDGSEAALFTLAGNESDVLSEVELPASRWPRLADRLPLRFVRRSGEVTAALDCSGDTHAVVDGALSINGVTLRLIDEEDSLASVVAPLGGATEGTPLGGDVGGVPLEGATEATTPSGSTDPNLQSAGTDGDDVSGAAPTDVPGGAGPQRRRTDALIATLGVACAAAAAAFALWLLGALPVGAPDEPSTRDGPAIEGGAEPSTGGGRAAEATGP